MFWRNGTKLELRMVNAARDEEVEAILVFPEGITHKEALVAKQAFEEGVKHGKRLASNTGSEPSA